MAHGVTFSVRQESHTPVVHFDEALRQNPTDEQLFAWFSERVRPEDIRAANEWLTSERIENLDRQDSEEGAAVEHR